MLPCFVVPQVTAQQIWLRKLDWDVEVDLQMLKDFVNWHRSLSRLSELRIPRRLFGFPQGKDSLTFHVFVDASRAAYAAVVFVCVETDAGIQVSLVEARSRVAPTKEISILRLELLAAIMGTRLMKFVQECLSIDKAIVYYWSDSSTVLTWIKTGKQWATFVWNRIQEIRKMTDPQQWRYVPGEMNPADVPSRGCTVEKLIESRYWEGPLWLKRDREGWPKSEYVSDSGLVDGELKKLRKGGDDENYDSSHVASAMACKVNGDRLSWYMKYFSSYIKILRMIGWILRFINNTRSNLEDRRNRELSVQELDAAERCVLRMSQRDSFKTEKDEKIVSLNIFTDDLGLIR